MAQADHGGSLLNKIQGAKCYCSFKEMDKITIEGRHKLILEDPCNSLIPRVHDAGQIKTLDNGHKCIVMHNGLIVNLWPYGEEFGQIFVKNGGVHEPQEEYVFDKVLKFIPNGGTMIEIGSNWAFYSLWFYSRIRDANCYMIEPDPEYLKEGIENFVLNGFYGDFTQSSIGKLTVDSFLKEKEIKHVNILHADVQGYELKMLEGATDALTKKIIDFIFISSHSQNLHNECSDFLIKYGYKIIASADYDNDTYCCDGVLIASASHSVETFNIGSYAKNKREI